MYNVFGVNGNETLRNAASWAPKSVLDYHIQLCWTKSKTSLVGFSGPVILHLHPPLVL